MLKNTILVFVLATFYVFSSKAEKFGTGELITSELDEKTVRFLCNSTPRTTYCALVCKLFPQFCQPDTTTTEIPTTTTFPVSTTSPPHITCKVEQICGKDSTSRHSCHFCAHCFYSDGSPPGEKCCAPLHEPVPGPSCSFGDLTCYQCQSTATTTVPPQTTTQQPTQVPSTTAAPLTTTITPPSVTCITISTVCVKDSANKDSCSNCAHCTYINGMPPAEHCCDIEDTPVPGPGCSLGDFSCYECQTLATTVPPLSTTEQPTPSPLTTQGTTTGTLTTTGQISLCDSPTFTCVGKVSGLYYEDEWDCSTCHHCFNGVIDSSRDCSLLTDPPPVSPTEKAISTAPGSVRCTNYCSSPTTPQTPTVPTTPSSPVETCTETCENRAQLIYPSPNDCRLYYFCGPDGISVETCVPQVFNYATLKCEEQTMATICYQCILGGPLTLPTTTLPPITTTQEPTTTTGVPTTSQPGICDAPLSCVGKTEGFFIDPFNCNQCIHCSNDVANIFTACSPDLDPISPTGKTLRGLSANGKCVNYCPPLNPTTTNIPTTVAPITTTPVPMETCTVTCANRAPGTYASPVNCFSYYDCDANGELTHHECPLSQDFNFVTMACENGSPSYVCYVCVPGVPLSLPTTTTRSSTTN